jgi:hypothetical protein
MVETLVCDYCGEEIGEKPVRHSNRIYCCEACAFEAARSADCGGRTDIHSSQPSAETESAEK